MNENSYDDVPYMIVEIDMKLLEMYGMCPIVEGKWIDSGISDLYYRLNPPRPEMRLARNIHIAHKRHIHSRDKQVSWDDMGARHDAKSFDANFTGIGKAREVARQVLRLPPDTRFEEVSGANGGVMCEEILRGVDIKAIISHVHLKAI